MPHNDSMSARVDRTPAVLSRPSRWATSVQTLRQQSCAAAAWARRVAPSWICPSQGEASESFVSGHSSPPKGVAQGSRPGTSPSRPNSGATTLRVVEESLSSGLGPCFHVLSHASLLLKRALSTASGADAELRRQCEAGLDETSKSIL